MGSPQQATAGCAYGAIGTCAKASARMKCPVSGKPMSALYYDVDLEVVRTVKRQP